jgi:hypothetical protein
MWWGWGLEWGWEWGKSIKLVFGNTKFQDGCLSLSWKIKNELCWSLLQFSWQFSWRFVGVPWSLHFMFLLPWFSSGVTLFVFVFGLDSWLIMLPLSWCCFLFSRWVFFFSSWFYLCSYVCLNVCAFLLSGFSTFMKMPPSIWLSLSRCSTCERMSVSVFDFLCNQSHHQLIASSLSPTSLSFCSCLSRIRSLPTC